MTDVTWKEAKPKTGGAFVKWTQKGMSVEGILRDVLESEGKYGKKNDYCFDGIDGVAGFTISDSPAMLKELLPAAKRGDRVKVVYTADKVLANGSTMKVFRVLVAEEGVASASAGEPQPKTPEDVQERDAAESSPF
jgi:hypothetical protein